MSCGFAIVDTGATHSFLAPRVIEELKLIKAEERQMKGATGSGRGELFDAVFALEFDDAGKRRERFFDIRAVSGPMLDSDNAPHVYLGRDLLVQLASMHFNFQDGWFELVAGSHSGREL